MRWDMEQARHIFQKDVRFLYREVSFLIALVLSFAIWQSFDINGQEFAWVFELVIAVAGALIIVRAIQAESIVGDCQFWITRPYNFKSLLAAKLLFILAFVNLPLLIAQMVILGADRFPIFSNAAGLVWSQVLMIFAVEVPVALVAAVTKGMIVPAAGALVLGLTVAGVRMQTDPLGFSQPFDWMRYSIAFVVATVVAPPLLYLQYRSRRTLANRLWAMGAAILGVAAFALAPWSAIFAVETLLSKQSFDLQFTKDKGAELKLFTDGKELQVVLPMTMSALPPECRPEFEDFIITLRAPDGRTLSLSEGQLVKDYQEAEKLGIRGHAPLDSAFFTSADLQPLSLHATFYVTVLGKPKGGSFSIPDAPRETSEGLQCYADRSRDLVCRAAFRLPPSFAESGNTGLAWEMKHGIEHTGSYSPFAATLSINPIRICGPYYIPPGRSFATTTMEEPLAFLRRDFEIRDLHIQIAAGNYKSSAPAPSVAN